jgi:ABC-type Na+ efflux pump permease subunit
MDVDKLARRWFLAALAYFLVGTLIGVSMAASGERALASVHSHATLLGWVSMALTGSIYRAFPAAARSRLAKWHFLLYQMAVPVMLAAVAALHLGRAGAEPLAGVASVLIVVSAAMFAWAVFAECTGRAARATDRSGRGQHGRPAGGRGLRGGAPPLG